MIGFNTNSFCCANVCKSAVKKEHPAIELPALHHPGNAYNHHPVTPSPYHPHGLSESFIVCVCMSGVKVERRLLLPPQ